MRLHSLRRHAKDRRAPTNTRQSGTMTKDIYLHDRGWAESSKQLHDQPWAQKEMMAFHKKNSKIGSTVCALFVMNYGQLEHLVQALKVTFVPGVSETKTTSRSFQLQMICILE